MDGEKRALSWQEFVDSGFDGRDYQFPDFEGTYEAILSPANDGIKTEICWHISILMTEERL